MLASQFALAGIQALGYSQTKSGCLCIQLLTTTRQFPAASVRSPATKLKKFSLSLHLASDFHQAISGCQRRKSGCQSQKNSAHLCIQRRAATRQFPVANVRSPATTVKKFSLAAAINLLAASKCDCCGHWSHLADAKSHCSWCSSLEHCSTSLSKHLQKHTRRK